MFVVFLVCQQMFLSFLEYSLLSLVDSMDRSEERRVGKECSS